MPRITLTGGSYMARSAAVGAQRVLNLYPEPIPPAQGEQAQFAYYPTPGLRSFCQLSGEIRCLYVTSAGDLIAVAGNTVYQVKPDATTASLGTISTGSGQVRMQDNGIVLFIVDGTAAGYYAAMTLNGTTTSYGTVTAIADAAFYGSATIAILDTFLLFVKPNSANWYTSPAEFSDESTTPFDSLYIASKTSYPDNLVGIAVVGQTIWVFGRQTTELWYDAGSSDFPFARIPSITFDQGCISPWTIATTAGQVFWLGRDRSGYAQVFVGAANTSQPVSDFAVEGALQSYGDLSDAIGHTYQQDGHKFYVLTIPSAGRTWVYDLTVGLWHERCGQGARGGEGRVRANCWASAFGMTLCGDYQNGLIYHVTPDALDDNGTPVKRQRAFPHLLEDGKRAIHRRLTLDMQTGSGGTVHVDWSDDRGATFTAPLALSLGLNGETFPSLWRLGLARDRVYRITWTDAVKTVIQSVWLDVEPVRS